MAHKFGLQPAMESLANRVRRLPDRISVAVRISACHGKRLVAQEVPYGERVRARL
jgi:hypothetical protein